MADERLRAIQQRAEARLFAIPGVHLVGLGPKEVGGQPTNEIAIKIGVRRKRPAAELPADELIPSEIEGVKTDVIEGPPGRRRAGLPAVLYQKAKDGDLIDELKYRPLSGGVNLCPKGLRGTATLGVFCRVENDASDTKIFALTCLHCIVPDFLPEDAPSRWLGKKVGQPTGKDSCCKSSSHIFGKVYNAAPKLDVALVRVNAGRGYLREIEEIGLVVGSNPLQSDPTEVPFLVKKRGAASALSGGWLAVFNTTASITVRGHTYLVRGVHVIKPNALPGHPEGGLFATEGDSGSAVLDKQNRVIGILFGGVEELVDDASIPGGKRVVSFDYVIPIQKIFDFFASEGDEALRLPLEIATGTVRGQEYVVPKASPRTALDEAEADDELEPAPLEEDARRTRIGGWYADLYYRYRDEVEELINGNRHMATIWHRRGGAALMHAFGRVLRLPTERVPTTLDGRSLADCLAGFARALARFGSEPLRRDLAAVQPTLPEVSGLCYSEILEALAAVDRDLPVAI
jgi:hypothetical protein